MADIIPSEGKPEELTTTALETPGLKFDRWWLLIVVDIALIIFLILVKPDPYFRVLKFVSDGIVITIIVTISSYIITVVFGLVGGLGRISKNKLINGIATLYVEVVRGIPLLVQLIFWYFAFTALVRNLGSAIHFEPFNAFSPDPVGMAVLGLSICYGAYMSEIYRAGIQSISKGQMEAARSLGMSQFQAMRYVILPQAIRVVLPPMGNEFISLLKDSSLVSVVAVADLTRRGREFMATTGASFETWAIVALIYLIMTIFSARVVDFIEKKTQTVER